MSGTTAASYTVVIPARANAPSTLYLGWYAKHPADTVQYTIDASGYLNSAGRTVVGAAVVTVNSTDITVSQVSGGARTTFFASGGQDVHSYGITWSVQLDDGTSLTRTIWLPILSLFPNTQTPTIIAKGDAGQLPDTSPLMVDMLAVGPDGSPVLLIGHNGDGVENLDITDETYTALRVEGATGRVLAGFLSSDLLAVGNPSAPALIITQANDGTSDVIVTDGTKTALRVVGATGEVQVGKLSGAIVNAQQLLQNGAAVSGSSSVAASAALPLSNWQNYRLRPDASVSAAASTTFQTTMCADAPFVGFVLEQQYDQATACTLTAVQVAVTAVAPIPGSGNLEPTDGHGTTLLWTRVTFGGANSVSLPTTTNNNVETITASDVVALQSLARTDGGTGYLLLVRGIATAPRPLNIKDGTNFNTVLGGRATGDFLAAGDYATNPTAATMPNNGLASSQLFVSGKFLSSSKCFNVAQMGASLDAGDTSTDYCNTAGLQAMVALSTPAQPIAFYNGAQSGLNSTDYTARAVALMARMHFDMVIIRAWTGNDHYFGKTTYAAAQALADGTWFNAMTLAAAVQAQGGVPVFICPTPKGQSDAFAEMTRQVQIARIKASGYDWVDPNPIVTIPFTAPTLPSMYAQFSSDQEHFTDLGQSVAAGTYVDGNGITASGLVQIIRKYI